MNKIVIERSAENICPLCKRELKEDFKIAEYNHKKVFLCPNHPSVE